MFGSALRFVSCGGIKTTAQPNQIKPKIIIMKKNISISSFLLYAAAASVLLACYMCMLVNAVDEKAKAECGMWIIQENTIADFFVTPSEKDQCDYYQIHLTAPVRG